MFCFVVVVLHSVDHVAVADGFYELADVSSGKCSKFSLRVEYVAEGFYQLVHYFFLFFFIFYFLFLCVCVCVFCLFAQNRVCSREILGTDDRRLRDAISLMLKWF